MVSRRVSLGLLVGLPASHMLLSENAEAVALADRENCAFLQDVRKTMRESAERGDLDPGARELVRCPLCSELLVVAL